ncbi:MAG: hypothetical protein ACKV2U_20625 [Bryobacteraceae bacterium]
MAKLRKPGIKRSEGVHEAIERVWPSGVVEMKFDADESYFWDIYPKLATSIQRLKGAELVHERKPEGGPIWFDESDPDEDPPDDQERSRSYHLFFVCPEGEAFTYDVELDGLADPDDEEGPRGTVSGKGRNGWSVSVSLLAPFAVITFGDMEIFDDGSTSEPCIESIVFTDSGKPFDLEAEFTKAWGEPVFEIFLKLRGRICEILAKNGIGVLPEEEWRKPVPGLRADEEVLLDHPGGPVRVLDALFFEGL